jgi:hypothetical protein
MIEKRIREAEETAGTRLSQKRWQDVAYWQARADGARDIRRDILKTIPADS